MKSESFDSLSKAIAAQQSRRGLLKVLFGGLGAAALAAVLPRSGMEPARVEAAFDPVACKTLCFQLFGANPNQLVNCVTQGLAGTGPCAVLTCPIPDFSPCTGNPMCNCGQDASGRSACACDAICAGLTPCTTDAQCPAGSVCLINTGCGASGVCAIGCSGTTVCPGVGAVRGNVAGRTIFGR
jgi:hypothetical protein